MKLEIRFIYYIKSLQNMILQYVTVVNNHVEEKEAGNHEWLRKYDKFPFVIIGVDYVISKIIVRLKFYQF